MSKPVPLRPPGCDDLTVEEELENLDAPRDRIAAHPDEASMPGTAYPPRAWD